MTDVRTRRLAALADLLRRGRHTRQDELVAALREAGHEVTQATVSRDLVALGAVKLRTAGETRYALPASAAATPADRLPRLFGEWVQSVTAAGNLIVLKTPPGSAHLVGVGLDAAEPAGMVGTICGDDTLFVACASTEASQGLARIWQAWLSTDLGDQR